MTGAPRGPWGSPGWGISQDRVSFQKQTLQPRSNDPPQHHHLSCGQRADVQKLPIHTYISLRTYSAAELNCSPAVPLKLHTHQAPQKHSGRTGPKQLSPNSQARSSIKQSNAKICPNSWHRVNGHQIHTPPQPMLSQPLCPAFLLHIHQAHS